MILAVWRTLDTVIAIGAGLVAASYATFRAARRHLNIDPFLSGAIGRGFALAMIWIVVLSVVYSFFHWPFTELFS
jgi:hypothetical protein